MMGSSTRSTRSHTGSAARRRPRFVAAALVAVLTLVVSAAPVLATRGSGSARPTASLWHPISEMAAARVGAAVDITTLRSRSFSLERAGMRSALASAPMEFTRAARTSPLILSIPAPGRGFQRFAIQESPVVAPELGARYPFVRTYNGQGIDDPAATIRLDLGRTGFHAQVLSPNGDWFIDPLYRHDQSVYVTYFKRDLVDTHGPFMKYDADDHDHADATGTTFDAARVVGSELRTYRLALATTGEYSTFHGGTVALVHNELVTSVNRVTGVYERELSIRLQLVANNDSLIYLNAATDPYTNTNPSQLLSQNQTNIDSVIGNANYDIGHVYSTGGGGLAGLGVVGRQGQKARGETGLAAPVGDAFYIDYVAHEMGHQFGGNHSFNGNQGSCNGNGNGPTAMEPGSGTTIMAYAGICGADDLQPHSDDYFAAISFDEIVQYTTNPGSPGNLGAAPSGNTPPTVSVVGGPFTIPIRTPFTLTASGSDVNAGDVVSFDWEQYDGGAIRALNNPSKPNGALFRSWAPTTSPSRTFPSMSSILANTTTANTGTCAALPGGLPCWAEFLPTVARPMNFRVTIRDNHAGAGGVNTADVLVTAVGTAPFRVTSPNTAVTLPGGSAQTVTWDPAGSNLAPINTANVNILLSTDGGSTFPTTLIANTPNDGTQSVTLPAVSSTTARIKIEAVGNVFFDVSDANFSISTGGNIPPVANADSATTPVNTPVVVNVLANDTDSDGTLVPSSVTVVDTADHGGTSVNPTTGAITYTPSSGFTGADSFTYRVSDDDGAPSNDATVSLTVGSGGTTDLAPSSFTVLVGSTGSGTVGSLAADDGDLLVVNSTTKGTRTSTWYGSFTGVDNATSTLSATYRGNASLTCTQTIAMWRWTDSTWVQLDSRSVGTTEIEVANLTPAGTLADFVSGTTGAGEVRVRLSCSTGAGTFGLGGDLLRLTVGSGTPTHTLSVATAGTGTGIVSSSPAGIACPGDCSESYTQGTLVTLTATPTGGSTFAGWSGDCAGTGTCQVTMSAARSVTATFTGGGGGEVFPTSFTVLVGTAQGGTAASLAADDDNYLVVGSTTKATRTATWYGAFTGVSNATTTLAASYTGKSSLTCTQTIAMWRWTDSTWVQLDSRSIGTAEVQVSNLTPPGTLADFVSGTTGAGEVRVRISCSTGTAAFSLSGDLMKLAV
jgi:hypothetical protein